MRLPRSLALAGFLTVAVPAPVPAQPPQDGPSQTAVLDYVFTGGAGMLFFHVRPDRTADFEAVAARVSAALASSDDPVRRQQALHWKLFRSSEQHENAIYVAVFDPVVEGGDYDPVKILSEEAPDEVQALYGQLQAAIVRIERMGLTAVR